MALKFTPVRREDFIEVEKLIMSLYDDDPEGQTMTKEKINKTWKHLMIHPDKGRIVTFKDNAMILGYAIIIFYWSNEYGGDILHIDELYVLPTYRNKGIATAFFNYIEKMYQNILKAIQLEVTPSNRKGMHYYRRLGFLRTSNTHLIKELNR